MLVNCLGVNFMCSTKKANWKEKGTSKGKVYFTVFFHGSDGIHNRKAKPQLPCFEEKAKSFTLLSGIIICQRLTILEF